MSNALAFFFRGFLIIFVSKKRFVTRFLYPVTSFLSGLCMRSYICVRNTNTNRIYMKDTSSHITVQVLSEVYVIYRPVIFRYIFRKLNGCMEAEDLVQDAFLRLLEYRDILRTETIRSFLYTIVRNLVVDYLRHHYKRQKVMACLQESVSASGNDVENKVIAKDLLLQEKAILCKLPLKAQIVYSKSRFAEKTASEISVELHLSRRTVEGYLLKGRKVVREYMKQCV